eukprot:g54163.t1
MPLCMQIACKLRASVTHPQLKSDLSLVVRKSNHALSPPLHIASHAHRSPSHREQKEQQCVPSPPILPPERVTKDMLAVPCTESKRTLPKHIVSAIYPPSKEIEKKDMHTLIPDTNKSKSYAFPYIHNRREKRGESMFVSP